MIELHPEMTFFLMCLSTSMVIWGLAIIVPWLLMRQINAWAFILTGYRVFHSWRYRNPANRTCKECGRYEHGYGHSWSPWFQVDWWEEMAGSPPTEQQCGIRKRTVARGTYSD